MDETIAYRVVVYIGVFVVAVCTQPHDNNRIAAMRLEKTHPPLVVRFEFTEFCDS